MASPGRQSTGDLRTRAGVGATALAIEQRYRANGSALERMSADAIALARPA